VASRSHAPLVVCVYASMAVLLGFPAWLSPSTRYIGVGGDPLQTMWFLTWTPHALTHLQNPWLSDVMNYPQGFSLVWNGAQFFSALVLWPVTALAGPMVSYNALVTLSFVASAGCAYAAIKRFVPNTMSAAAGGLVYGFSPFMIAAARGHTHLLLAFVPPLMLLVLDELIVRQRLRLLRVGALLGLLAIVQFFISEEMLAIELIGATTAVVTVAVLNRDKIRAHVPYVVRGLGIAVAVTVPVLAWPLWTQVFGPLRHTGIVHAPDVYVSDALGFVLPTTNQLIRGLTPRFTGNPFEWAAYIGVPLLVCSLVTVWRRRWTDQTALVAGVVAASSIVLSLGPHLHILGRTTGIPLPWVALGRLPLVGSLLPGRLMVIAFLALALLFAQFCCDVLASKQPRGVLLAGLALAFLVPPLPLPHATQTAPGVFRHLDSYIADGDVALALPYVIDQPGYKSFLTMYWQAVARLRFRMPGGYVIGPTRATDIWETGPCSAHDSVTAGTRTPWTECTFLAIELSGRPPTPEDLTHVRAELDAIRPALVIVGPSAHQHEAIAAVSKMLDAGGGPFVRCPSVRSPDVALWVSVRNVRERIHAPFTCP
jgi:hypothetical protein